MNNSPLMLQAIIGVVLGLIALLGWWLWDRHRSKKPRKEKETVVAKPVSADLLDKTAEITLDLEARGVLSTRDGRLLRQAAITQVPKPKPVGKYLALAFTEEGIKFPKIPVRVGNVIQLEPSLPKHGAAYLVVETKDGDYKAYDPRLAPLLSKETPQRAFNATNWYREVNAVYANKFGLWDKINVVLIAVGLIVAGLVSIVALDKL